MEGIECIGDEFILFFVGIDVCGLCIGDGVDVVEI